MAAQSEGRLVEMFGAGTAAVVSISRLLPIISLYLYSLVRLVVPNTEELISRPFMALLKI